MNPFDLRGPEFLLFYAVAIVALIGALAWILRQRRNAAIERARFPLEDPMLIAYLAGGAQEAVAVAIASLVDRGLLKIVDEDRLETARRPSSRGRPIEEAILDVCAQPSRFRACVTNRAVRECCDSFRIELEQLGVLPGSSARATDFALAAIVWAALIIVAVIKLDLAIARGHKNIQGLIMLMIVATVAVVVVTLKIREGAASAAIENLRVLFADLRRRGPKLERGQATSDLEYLAAVYGAAMLPVSVFPEREAIFPHPASMARSRGAGSSHSCGTGSGCGGGGCGGGGGGGCGGCGS